MIKLLFLFLTLLLAQINATELQNFSANFTQTITDEYNKTIKYSGKITAKMPSDVVYNYTSPMQKNVYLLGQKVIIVEDELEQIIVRNLNNGINLFEILKNSKKDKHGVYISEYRGYEFKIHKNKNVPKSIIYSDELDNIIRIDFFNIQKNKKLPTDIFRPNIPAFYDVIKE